MPIQVPVLSLFLVSFLVLYSIIDNSTYELEIIFSTLQDLIEEKVQEEEAQRARLAMSAANRPQRHRTARRSELERASERWSSGRSGGRSVGPSPWRLAPCRGASVPRRF